MKLETVKNPTTILVRLVPENEDDEKALKKADKLLHGTSAVHTFDKKLSLIFKIHSKRAGAK